MTLEERLWKTFNKALGQYQLIDEDDKILVGLSGGKDSLCLLEFLARRSKIHVPHFTVEALHVRMENVQYETDTTYLQSFCNRLGIPLQIITTSFDSSLFTLHSSLFTQTEASLFSLLLAASQTTLQPRSGVGMHQDSLRTSSRRHHPYSLDELDLSGTFCHHARQASHEEDATHHHPSPVSLS